ncbi:MAG: FtsX-like permease family protein [Phycisphaerales bacterium]|nr:MAG: FtsX-like permease family protein [Phycisphaerales bacterium]
MTVLNLVVKELWHRKVNFLLAVLAVVTAVAMFIAFFTAGKASERETARLMLDMGYNLRIIAKDTDINQFLLTGLANETMPEEYLEKLASAKGISYNHLLATLQKRITWRGVDVVLTGLAPEVCPPGRAKPPMIYSIKPGELYVGYGVAQALGLKEGDAVDIEGKAFTVAKCLAESGGVDDVRLQCNLREAQEILGLPGQINEINAVDCLCFVEGGDPVSILRKQIGLILPEAQVYQAKAMATTRAKQRQMVRNLFAVIMPSVVIACGLWIGILAIMNVRDRQQEIGIMRALGYGSSRVAVLFLGKAVVIGLFGAILGFLIGTGLAFRFGPDIFKITAQTIIKPELALFVRSVVFAPVFAAISSFIPAMIAVTYDPAVTLREE